MKFKWLILIAALSLLSFVVGCGGGSGGDDPNPPTPAVTVELDANKITLCTDTNFGNIPIALTAKVVSTKGDVSQAVTWKSSNTGIATVTSSGDVAAKGNGNCTITATSTADTTASASCSVSVVSKPTTKILSKGLHTFDYTNRTVTLKVADTTNNSYLGAVESNTYKATKKATPSDRGFIINKSSGDIMFADLVKASETKFSIQNGGNCLAYSNSIITDGEYEVSGGLPWEASNLFVRSGEKKMVLVNKEYVPAYELIYNWSYGDVNYNDTRWWAPTIGWYVEDDDSTLISYN